MIDDFQYSQTGVGHSASTVAKEAITHPENNNERLDKLELTVKSLSIMNEALYEILVAKLGVTESDLELIIEQVMASRIHRAEAKSTCYNCGRLVPAARQKCMYCGGDLGDSVKLSPFDR